MSHRDHGSPALGVMPVACAVIVIAILFPVFLTRQSPSRIDACLSSEKQLGLALIQYAQDSDGQLPGGTQGAGEGWGGQVFPYVKTVEAYRCDDDATTGTAASPVISYGYNANTALHPALGHYPAPAHTVLLFEVAHDTGDVTVPDEGASHGAASFSAAGDGTDGALLSGRPDVRYATGLLGGRTPAVFSQFDPPRHDAGSNFLLADAHVQWLSPQAVSSGTDAVRAAAAQMGVTQGAAAGTADRAYQATFSVR